MDGVAKYTPALAVDAGGRYHVVCVVQEAGVWRLRYLTNVGGAPTDVLLAVGSLGGFGSGASPAVAVEPDGVAHVVYRGVSGVYRIHHAENDAPGSTTWSWQTLVSPNGEDLGSDVEVEAGGTVHVAVSGDDCFECTRRTFVFRRPPGGSWGAPAPIAHVMGLAGPSLAVDTGGMAHVALSEVGGNILTGRVFHASARTGWSPSLVIGDDHASPCLALDELGQGHLVCTTGPNTGVEDVLYLRSQPLAIAVGEPVAAASRWAATPNPFAARTVLRIPGSGARARAGSRSVLVCDATGRVVRRLDPNVATGGRMIEIDWDGRDEAGRDLPGGVYFVSPPGKAQEGGTRTAVVKLR
jgi:hypothetical protein